MSHKLGLGLFGQIESQASQISEISTCGPYYVICSPKFRSSVGLLLFVFHELQQIYGNNH